jgi:hypothetical protein
MQLFVEHDARWIAAQAKVPAPACDAITVRRGAPETIFACRTNANILDGRAEEPWIFDPALPRSRSTLRLVSPSGSLAPDLLAAEPRTWLAAGRAALDAACDQVRPARERHDATLCFVPHCRHVLSDATSAIRFRAARTGQPFEIALDPVALLEGSMLERIEDHLDRIFAALGPVASAIFLADCRPPEQEDQPPVRVALGEGVLPRERTLELLRAHVPPTKPIVIDGRAIEPQLKWLGAAGP